MVVSSRDRLIEVASELFYEHGFHAIGLDRILAEVGVTKTTFYNHFESKDDLIIQVLDVRDRKESEEWLAEVQRRAGEDPRGQLLAFFDLLADWFCEPTFRGCMFMKAVAEFPSPHDPIHEAAGKHDQRMFEHVRDTAQRAGAEEPAALARQLMILISGAITARHAGSSPDVAISARATAELLIAHHLPPVAVPA